jgi:hypothetical protein
MVGHWGEFLAGAYFDRKDVFLRHQRAGIVLVVCAIGVISKVEVEYIRPVSGLFFQIEVAAHPVGLPVAGRIPEGDEEPTAAIL